MKHKVWALLIIVEMVILSGCRGVRYIEVPEYHIDTLIVSKYQRDSIYLHDSTYVKEKGDTVLIERWHTKYVDRLMHDTLYQSKTDSIPYPVQVTVEVPAQLSWWQQTRIYAGDVMLVLLLLGAIYGILKLIK